MLSLDEVRALMNDLESDLQYVKFSGEGMTSNVDFEKKFSGPLITDLSLIDDFIKINIIKEREACKNRLFPGKGNEELFIMGFEGINYECGNAQEL